LEQFEIDQMRTPLYERHCALGAKIVDFNGWEMPIQYKGSLHEHHTVRKAVGLFDVSHMGRIAIEGPDAESLLDYLSTNQITDRKVGTATYTVWCDENGKCIDDLIIYRETPGSPKILCSGQKFNGG
jgi:aminomethyltransferase